VCHACANLRAPRLVESSAIQLTACAASEIPAKRRESTPADSPGTAATRHHIIRSDVLRPRWERSRHAVLQAIRGPASRRGDSNPGPIITRNSRRRRQGAWLSQIFAPNRPRVPRVCQSARCRCCSEAHRVGRRMARIVIPPSRSVKTRTSRPICTSRSRCSGWSSIGRSLVASRGSGLASRRVVVMPSGSQPKS
jgi:hypothetical protein